MLIMACAALAFQVLLVNVASERIEPVAQPHGKSALEDPGLTPAISFI